MEWLQWTDTMTSLYIKVTLWWYMKNSYAKWKREKKIWKIVNLEKGEDGCGSKVKGGANRWKI